MDKANLSNEDLQAIKNHYKDILPKESNSKLNELIESRIKIQNENISGLKQDIKKKATVVYSDIEKMIEEEYIDL
ncbi:hypothetical protein [Tenacibaculum sp. 190524A02b]|uniref:hypothetical protein n=1 Tax=Tenacibaculum vairaonense TaxID=3137860 RepID=UPI0031FA4BA2